ncbi:reversion-inducing cysteine-rich protein with Kazal motifs-like [Oppia nitens]|uniref:reversion-inducing cysteine-rich protein with Kazal motifs-like n=1 Tax=Oppia nitens TaxID=1686743 RepID=UPI0023DAB05F|nr:reversion-inducing cysteine-rich protein with Kazal motifs-like [Oppia nitens]
MPTIKNDYQLVEALVVFCGQSFSNKSNDDLWQCLLSQSDPVSDISPTHKLNKNRNINANKKKVKGSRRKTRPERRRPSSDPMMRLWSSALMSSHQSMTVSPSSRSKSHYRLTKDFSKLMCCAKASTNTCRQLCQKTWGYHYMLNWEQFDRICRHSSTEPHMNQCLDDTEGVCQPGCQALEFCQTFNNRPEQLYRKCSAEADSEAKDDYETWMRGAVKYNIINISVKNVAICQTDIWKLIACTIHIKPCLDDSHYNNICRSSCVDIISECIDSNHRPSTHLSAQSICNLISTNSSDNCIDIQTFLKINQMSTNVDNQQQPRDTLINPCNPNTCLSNQICLVNNNCRFRNCLPFKCVSACHLGDSSKFRVISGTAVKLLSPKDDCHHLCKCGTRGQLIDCYKICDHKYRDNCEINTNKNVTHLTQIAVNERQCICFNSRIQCNNSAYHFYQRRQCLLSCRQDYWPVCAINGQTFPNRCYAQCSGFTEEEYVEGRCDTTMDWVNRSSKQRCVKKSHICLTADHCPQYECVSEPIDCAILGSNPVCDTNGDTHPNLCWLLKKKQKFAYYGRCLYFCSHSGPVCAFNGQTYQSECTALSHSVPVDYYSHCNHTSACDGIQCSQQPMCVHPYYDHYLDYNCCPYCGSVAKLIYDKYAIHRIDGRFKANYAMTVEEVAKHLSYLIRLFGCQSYVYLSIDDYIVFMVKPVAIEQSLTQLEQCHRELVRVVTLINNQSPIITTQLPLSLLVRGKVLQSSQYIQVDLPSNVTPIN